MLGNGPGNERVSHERVMIPISDPEAQVSYDLCCRDEDRRIYQELFQGI